MENNLNKYFNSNQKEYTYNNYKNLQIKNQMAIQCLFNGSKFDNCTIKTSNFSRSDFEGMLNANLRVEKTIFQNADIKSNVWNKCEFIDCDFTDGFFTDNEYIECLFKNCIFSGAVANDNIFKSCIFESTDLSKSTFTKNVFNNVKFNNTNLGNCSFYKQILSECKYDNVSMNIDSLGQVFGLTEKNIKDITYIFLGKILGINSNKNYIELVDIFREKKWYYEIINLKYNLGMLTNFEYINSIAEYFVDKAKSGSILNADELDFFVMVVDYLYSKEELPLFSLVYSYNILYDTINTQEDTSNKIKLKSLIVSLQFNINNMFAKLFLDYDKKGLSTSVNNDVEIILHYENQTIIDFSKIINLSNNLFDYTQEKKAILKSVKKGTFIEIIATTAFGVFSLKAIMYGIKGILLDVIDIKNGVKQLCDKNNSYPEIIVRENKTKRSIIFKNIESLSRNINKETIKECSLVAKLIDNVIFKE